jgi:hypothetical protein
MPFVVTADKADRTMTSMIIRTYSELIRLPTFEERFQYLKLDGVVGEATFGFDRYLNQRFYTSDEWRAIRDKVIIRDNGCDLGIADREIYGKILIHHMNPISKRDILTRSDFLLNPEYLICTYKNTHDAIHYGDESLLIKGPIVRTLHDTCPWKH